MPVSAFVDESKDPSYVVAAAFMDSAKLSATRRTLKTLLYPNQRRLHFTAEKPRRRLQLLEVITGLDVEMVIHSERHGRHQAIRSRALTLVTSECLTRGAERLVIESDRSVEAHDRSVIADELRGKRHTLVYTHLQPQQEPMLWISDAVAWCWQPASRVAGAHPAHRRESGALK